MLDEAIDTRRSTRGTAKIKGILLVAWLFLAHSGFGCDRNLELSLSSDEHSEDGGKDGGDDGGDNTDSDDTDTETDTGTDSNSV